MYTTGQQTQQDIKIIIRSLEHIPWKKKEEHKGIFSDFDPSMAQDICNGPN